MLNVQFSHKGVKRNRVHVDKGNAKVIRKKQSISLRMSVSRNILFDNSRHSPSIRFNYKT